MRLCTYVYVYICMHVSMYVSIKVYVYMCMYEICICAHVSVTYGNAQIPISLGRILALHYAVILLSMNLSILLLEHTTSNYDVRNLLRDS